jgi:hypothetical protein
MKHLLGFEVLLLNMNTPKELTEKAVSLFENTFKEGLQ